MAPAFGTPAFRTSLGAVHLLWEAASVPAHTSWEAVSIGLGLIDIKASAQICALAPRAAVPTIRTLLASEILCDDAPCEGARIGRPLVNIRGRWLSVPREAQRCGAGGLA